MTNKINYKALKESLMFLDKKELSDTANKEIKDFSNNGDFLSLSMSTIYELNNFYDEINKHYVKLSKRNLTNIFAPLNKTTDDINYKSNPLFENNLKYDQDYIFFITQYYEQVTLSLSKYGIYYGEEVDIKRPRINIKNNRTFNMHCFLRYPLLTSTDDIKDYEALINYYHQRYPDLSCIVKSVDELRKIYINESPEFFPLKNNLDIYIRVNEKRLIKKGILTKDDKYKRVVTKKEAARRKQFRRLETMNNNLKKCFIFYDAYKIDDLSDKKIMELGMHSSVSKYLSIYVDNFKKLRDRCYDESLLYLYPYVYIHKFENLLKQVYILISKSCKQDHKIKEMHYDIKNLKIKNDEHSFIF